MRKILRNMLTPLLLAVLTAAALGFAANFYLNAFWPSPGTKMEQATEKFSFPTGEILVNESFLSPGRDSVRVNQIYFQESASAPREFIGDITTDFQATFSLNSPGTHLFRSGDRTAVILWSYVLLMREMRKGSPYWVTISTSPNATASYFLRTFLTPGEAGTQAADLTLMDCPQVPYVFDRLDLEHNILITRRDSSDSRFPQFLVYSGAEKYLYPGNFDLERTRSLNGLLPPEGGNFVIDFSVVTYLEGSRSEEAREDALSRPGAKEVDAQTFPLSAVTWTETKYSFIDPDGKKTADRFEALFGFQDPLPDYVSIFWRKPSNWHFVKTGKWYRAGSGGMTSGIHWITFFRVRPVSETSGDVAKSDPPLLTPAQNLKEPIPDLQEFWAHNTRGNAYRKLGQYEEAIQEYKEMIKINPQHELSYNAIDWTYALITKERALTPPEQQDRKLNLEMLNRH